MTDANGFTKYSTFNLLTDYDAMAYSLYAADEWQVTEALRFDFGVRYDTQDIEGTIRAGSQGSWRAGVPTDLDGNPATTYDRGVSLIGANRSTVDEDFDNTGFSLGFNYEFTPQHAMFGHYTDSGQTAALRRRAQRRAGEGSGHATSSWATRRRSRRWWCSRPCSRPSSTTCRSRTFFPTARPSCAGPKRARAGIELEGEFQPIDALGIRFSITQQDPTYEGFTGSAAGNTGNVIRRIPKTMARITPTYTFMDGAARVYFTYTYAGKRYRERREHHRAAQVHASSTPASCSMSDATGRSRSPATTSLTRSA